MLVNINWDKFDSDTYRPLVVDEVPDFHPGTIAYDDYWDDQDDKCLNGYKPRPYMPRITGPHYFYLNMSKIKLLRPGGSSKTKGSPFYRELDRRLYDEMEQAQGKYGLIIGKPRRVGLSWFGASNCHHDLLFYSENEIGVAAGQEDKAQDFYSKVQYLIDNVRKEYRSGILIRNSEEIKLGYSYRENQQTVEDGLQSSMYMKTMYSKPTGFEGKSLRKVIFEEAGLFEDLIASHASTEPCFKEGAVFFGTPIIYGTGGEIDKSSKGYMTMWKNHKAYNLKKIFVSATDYYPGDGVPDEETGKRISFFDFRTGRTDSDAAFQHIMAEREIKKNSDGFVKHIQSYPLKESDIFIKNSGGKLNRRKLNAQKNNLENCPFEILKGRLEWETQDSKTKHLIARAKNLKEKDKIHFSRGSKIVFVKDEQFGTIHKIMDPLLKENLPTNYHPDIVATDSYDDEVEEGKGSEGATIVYRCFYSVKQVYNLPIAYILDRGTSDDDDEFYSNTFRLCCYYDTEMLLEWTKVLIKSYFEGIGALKYLMRRPDLEESGYNSKAINKYGFKMSNQHADKLVTRLLISEVNENFKNIWFEEILDHLIDFGESNADLASAYGMAMIAKLDMFGDLSDGIDEDRSDVSHLNALGHWASKPDGSVSWETYGNKNKDPFAFNKEDYRFDPEYDLSGEQKISYESQKNIEREEGIRQQKEILAKYDNDVMAFALEDFNNRNQNN